MNKELGTRIRKYRENRKLNQTELAKMVGVTTSGVSNWEQGLNAPAADHIADLCRALQVSPSELLDVRLDATELNEQERKVIMAYRTKTELQPAVNILLGIDTE